MVMLVSPEGFSGDPVDATESVDPAAQQNGVNGRWWQAELAAVLDRTETSTPPDPHDPSDQLWWCLEGIECGRLDRSAIPGSPSARKRAAHFRAVMVETMNIFDAPDGGHPIINDQARQTQRSARSQGGIRVGHEGLLVREAVSRQLPSQPEAFARQ